MREIIIHNNSIGKTRKRETNILDNFCIRTNNNTWLLKSTLKTSIKLYEHLKEISSKNTIIVAYYNNKIIWSLGNTDLYEKVQFKISSSSRKHIFFKINIKKEPYFFLDLLNITQLAALSHDIGKGNVYFQEKLKSGKIFKNYYRHELLSFLYLDNKETENQQFIDIQNTKKIKYIVENDINTAAISYLSHHKLPDIETNFILLDRYKNDIKSRSKKNDIKNNLEMKKFPNYLINEINKLKIKINGNELNDIKKLKFIYSRLALMLADHYISSLSSLDNKNYKNNKLYANSSQELTEHTFLIKKESKKILKDIMHLKDDFPYLSDFYYQNIINNSITTNSKYKWQLEGYNFIKDSYSKEKYSGAFIVVTSEVGSGKTRGNFLSALALSEGKARISTLLPLRSLTYQAASEYIKELNIPKQETSILVGQKILNNEIEKKRYEENNTEEEYIPFIENSSKLFSKINYKYINNQLRGMDKSYVYAPLLVSTIDYIIKSIDYSSSNHILSHIRLLTSDIIIDEIDSFSKSDLISISKFCWLIGIFGGNLIISSGSMTSELIECLYISYKSGLKEYNIYNYNEDKECYKCLINNNSKPQLLDSSIKENIDNIYEELYKKNEKDKKNKYIFKDIKNGNDFLTSIMELHNINCLHLDGIEVSTCLIKLDRTKDVIKITNEIIENFEKYKNINFKIVSYHSRIPFIIKSELELKLNEYLNRKQEYKIFETDIVKEGIKEGKNITILIVVSTSIEERGRDHDFDYQILDVIEPQTLIQSDGRVRRHREKGSTCYILKNNFRKIKDLNIEEDLKETVNNVFSYNILRKTNNDKLVKKYKYEIFQNINNNFINNFLNHDYNYYNHRYNENFKFRKNNKGIKDILTYYNVIENKFYYISNNKNINDKELNCINYEINDKNNYYLLNKEFIENVCCKYDITEENYKKYFHCQLSLYLNSTNDIYANPLQGIYY